MSRVAYVAAPGRLELRDVPVPAPGPGEVVVRVDAALTCGTDLKLLRRGHARLPMPAPFGHEFAGTVAALGAGVTAFREGDPLMQVPTAPCNACDRCRSGRENLCAHLIPGMLLGAYADQVTIPAHIVRQHVWHRPAHLAPENAAVLEPLACVVHGANRLPPIGDRSVLIIGDGPIALLFARVATLRGAAHVLLAGRHPNRLAVAAAWGASTVLLRADDATHPHGVAEPAHALRTLLPGGADVTVECVGTSQTWRLASDMTAAGGTALLFGGCAPGAEATFDATHLHYDEVDHIGAFHYTPRAAAEARDLLVAGDVDAAPLVTHRRPLAELREALDLMQRREAIKVAVIP